MDFSPILQFYKSASISAVLAVFSQRTPLSWEIVQFSAQLYFLFQIENAMIKWLAVCAMDWSGKISATPRFWSKLTISFTTKWTWPPIWSQIKRITLNSGKWFAFWFSWCYKSITPSGSIKFLWKIQLNYFCLLEAVPIRCANPCWLAFKVMYSVYSKLYEFCLLTEIFAFWPQFWAVS